MAQLFNQNEAQKEDNNQKVTIIKEVFMAILGT